MSWIWASPNTYLDVDVRKGVVALDVHIGAPLREVNAGAVHQDIDNASVVFHRVLDRGLHLAFIRDVRFDRNSVTASRDARVHRLLHRTGEARVFRGGLRQDNHGSAPAREPHRDGLADSP